MRVVIVGGGIGGLSAALFLHRVGAEVTVVEQSRGFGEVGAGIQLSPNATRLLERIGVLGEVAAVAVTPRVRTHRRWEDRSVLMEAEMGRS